MSYEAKWWDAALAFAFGLLFWGVMLGVMFWAFHDVLQEPVTMHNEQVMTP